MNYCTCKIYKIRNYEYRYINNKKIHDSQYLDNLLMEIQGGLSISDMK